MVLCWLICLASCTLLFCVNLYSRFCGCDACFRAEGCLFGNVQSCRRHVHLKACWSFRLVLWCWSNLFASGAMGNVVWRFCSCHCWCESWLLLLSNMVSRTSRIGCSANQAWKNSAFGIVCGRCLYEPLARWPWLTVHRAPAMFVMWCWPARKSSAFDFKMTGSLQAPRR